MSPNPAELPEGEGGGSGRIDWSRIRGGVGGPNELPAIDFTRGSITQLVNEIFRLRDRVHSLESNILSIRMHSSANFGVGGPQELPEGEGGGGGGGIHFPGEIHEIAELPISRVLQDFAAISKRFADFERSVTQQLNTIVQRLDAMKR